MKDNKQNFSFLALWDAGGKQTNPQNMGKNTQYLRLEKK